MIAGLKPYAAYKDSGQDWLGDIPAHWDHLRAKFLFGEIDERSQTGREELLSVSHITGVTPRSQKKITMFLAKSNVGHKVCRPGDVVINTMWAWMSALGVAKHTGLVSPAYGVYRPLSDDRILPRYADHLLRTPTYAAEYLRRSTGVNPSRLRLYPEHFLRVVVVTPPLAEQASIVRFLDHALQQVDTAIRAKRKTIALLNEQKQAIIHRAVTRGLDADVPLKDSGLAWLGQIPAHWEVLSLKRVLKRLIDCEHKTAPQQDDGDLFVVRTTAVKKGKLVLKGAYATDKNSFRRWTRRGIPESGDVIFTREAPAGEACLVPTKMSVCLGQRTVLMKLKKHRIHEQFLVHQIYAGPARTEIVLATQGSTVGHFNMSDIGTLPILLPPFDEQLSILKAIDAQTAAPEKTITAEEKEIALLMEYRTRLIADVVTGKLDVREAAAKLPEISAAKFEESDALGVALADEPDDELIEEAAE